jgi:hypothetical protein
MSWFGDDHPATQSHKNYQTAPKHEAHLSHEAIGGAAAYEAMKAYDEHCAKNGKPSSHAKAKEIAAGLLGAFIDREVETKGLDFIDKQKAKKHAQEHVEEVITVNNY